MILLPAGSPSISAELPADTPIELPIVETSPDPPIGTSSSSAPFDIAPEAAGIVEPDEGLSATGH